MIDKVTYWIELADYDYIVAQDLQKAKHWLYVAFMCHQVLEKTLKAYWTATQPNDPPYIHNLTRLAEGCGLNQLMNEELNLFIEMMTPMNIEARYPDYKSLLASSLNKNVCAEILTKTQQLQQWIKSKL